MRRRLAVIAVFCLSAGSAGAFRSPPPGAVLPDFDVRPRVASAATRVSPALQRELEQMAHYAGRSLRVRHDGALDRVRWVHAVGAPLSLPSSAPAETVARDFLAARATAFGFAASDLEALALRYLERSASGASHVGFQQMVDGLPVHRGYVRVDLGPSGRVLAAGVADARPGFEAAARPALGPADAVERALASIGLELRVATPAVTGEEILTLAVDGLRQPARADLIWFPIGDGARLTWRTWIASPDYAALYETLLDADTGEILFRVNLTRYAESQANVFTHHPDAGGRQLETLYDDAANVDIRWPGGWLFTDTTDGNNTIAMDDLAGDDETTAGFMPTAAAGPPQLFDPPYSADWIADLDLAVVNLFWGVNRAHEWFYPLGFDEAAGNFQADNFGRGGLGGDPVRADAQDEASTLLDMDPMNDVDNNANFSTPADGQNPRMQMYIWNLNTPGVWRDSDLDIGVIFHEFGHGVSNRLVGGRGDAGCLFGIESGSMGEGWSDYFAGAFLNDPVIGGWLAQDQVRGIRTEPMSADSYTYGSLCTITGDPTLPCEVHADGEIWAQALWELRSAMIAARGLGIGDELADRLVVGGMKFTACQPTFLDGRDGILLADQALNGGIHQCLIWQVFAGNGMGLNAVDDPGAFPQPMPTEDFTLPTECVSESSAAWSQAQIHCDDSARVTITDPDLTLPATVVVTSDAGDSLTLDSVNASPAGPPAFTTDPFPVVGVAMAGDVDTGDAILQALRGDTLTVTYVDDSSGMSRTADATLVCSADLSVLGHRFVGGTCDDDTLAGFPGLPGFLDAGESAVLEVDLANDEAFDLTDVVVTLTSSNPNVVIDPPGPWAIGTLAATDGAARSVRTLRFLAIADPSVTSADTTDLSLDVTAKGVDGPTTPIQWTIPLHQDYQLVSRSFSEDFESSSPTVSMWSHGPTRMSPTGDEWDVVRCMSVSGMRAYKNGGGDPQCRDYSDDQGDPFLASPPFRFLSGGVEAAQLTRLRFEHHVQLAVPTDPIGGVCDAEAVVLVLSNDPMSIDTSNVLDLFTTALGGWTVIPLLGLDSNTSGFEPQDIDLSIFPFPDLDLTADVYLTWVFAVDVTNDSVPAPGCLFFNYQGEGYYLDDVILDWDEVAPVAQTAVCTPSCLSLASSAPMYSGGGCAGDPVDLTGADSLVVGCAGALEYRWHGGELGAPGPFGATADVTVMPATAETYTLDVQCSTDPACADTTTALVVPEEAVPTGGYLENALRMTWAGPDLRLDWSSQPLAPRVYAVVGGEIPRTDVVDAVIVATPVVDVDDSETSDVGLPGGGDLYYEVFPRELCGGGPAIP